MIKSYDFLKLIIDSVSEQIAVLDQEGMICFVNKAWNDFAKQNGYPDNCDWDEVNYLKVCDDSASLGDKYSDKAVQGIRKVMNKELVDFHFEYPGHGPNEKRWFMMTVTSSQLQGTPFYIISHQNITESKLTQEAVLNLSRLDGLTNIPNRRYFDEFINNEWRRCIRLGYPITLGLLDLDHFKLLNDNYGHQAGDYCLKKIGMILKNVARRPGDLSARYGRE